MTDHPAIELIRHDRVAELRLCRPELLNRFDMQLHRELEYMLGELGRDAEVLAVVLSSTGRVFSAGGDTDVMLECAGDMAKRLDLIDEGRRLFRAVADFPKPLVVALSANSYGLGTSLVLAADAIVSCPGVEFSDPHVVMALVAGDGGCVSWPTAMGMIRAKRHLLTGDPLSADDAFRMGVVTDMEATADAVLPAALALAARIAALPPLAVQLTKRALNKVMMARTGEVLDLGFYLEGITFGSADLQEAVSAFKGKRAPRWEGR
ncbi:enoyl-CoA hydratase/isomerase family protein [Sphingomonas profundi]|uniref:enoyl-CoA hydratase/isomerase family protein n=1 Tax=Alterirhizorhabdus profundi TaxID=2681549 RepID=UPI0012E8D102|nr:enoyl-CoA hydratase/isomerase family protein [Sphingomonas profundi]